MKTEDVYGGVSSTGFKFYKKVVYIGNKDYHHLTTYKVYDAIEPVYSPEGLWYIIFNNNEVYMQYHETNFMSLDEWREKKIDLIL